MNGRIFERIFHRIIRATTRSYSRIVWEWLAGKNSWLHSLSRNIRDLLVTDFILIYIIQLTFHSSKLVVVEGDF